MDIKQSTQSALMHLQSGNLPQAELIFREILKIQPENATAYHFLGVIQYQRKDFKSSIEHITRALEIEPGYADAYNNLGIVLQAIGQAEKAIMCYKAALQIQPDFDRAHYNLGTVRKDQYRLNEAIQSYREAIRLNPGFFEAYNNLGLALQEQGKLKEAENSYRQALQLKPDFEPSFSNLLFLLNYDLSRGVKGMFLEHLRFAEKFSRPLTHSFAAHADNCSLRRPLRIGYVSPDFRRHSVSYFLEPALASHNHGQFEIFCYSDVLKPDTFTERLRGYADHWKNINGVRDEEVDKIIRTDSIDILVDLAGHTANNRMLLFAGKPAPIQVTWMGYPCTTGLHTMDYKIVDRYTDPPGMTENFYAEELVRLPECFICYLPDKDSPEITGIPALTTGHITFGSFNYFPKISSETIGTWAQILKSVPGSRLVLKTRNFSDKTTCHYARHLFAQRGVTSDRIDLLPIKLSFKEHLAIYNHIDIALDPFPYNGTTTTCEALWMGIPVVALTGSCHASRVSMSILSNIDLSWLSASTTEEYVQTALNLSNDIPTLKSLRETMRERMNQSVLCNAEAFTHSLESAYLNMWQKWCGS